MKYYIFIFAYLCFLSFPQNILANPVKEAFEQGVMAYAEQNYAKAEESFKKSIAMYPRLAPAYYYLGLINKNLLKGPEEIKPLFEKAIEIDPNYAEAYEALSKIYYSLGDFTTAEEYGLKAVAIKPELISGHLALGWIYLLGKSQPTSAIKYFKNVVGGNELPYAYLGLGIAYFMNGDRLMVFDMITSLRRIGQEGFARQLEETVRHGAYVPPEDSGVALIAPPKTPSVIDTQLQIQSINERYDASLPVHINTGDSYIADQNSSTSEDTLMTGRDRIKELQKNYERVNPGY